MRETLYWLKTIAGSPLSLLSVRRNLRWSFGKSLRKSDLRTGFIMTVRGCGRLLRCCLPTAEQRCLCRRCLRTTAKGSSWSGSKQGVRVQAHTAPLCPLQSCRFTSQPAQSQSRTVPSTKTVCAVLLPLLLLHDIHHDICCMSAAAMSVTVVEVTASSPPTVQLGTM